MTVVLQDFKDYIARSVWRDGDTVFETDIDEMITQAQARLGRELKLHKREATETGTATSYQIAYPSDHGRTRSFKLDDWGTFKVTPPNNLQFIRALIDEDGRKGDLLYCEKAQMELAWNVSSEAYTWDYYTAIPDLLVETSWLADDYYDLFYYAVLAETPIYLREEARQAVIDNQYALRLASVLEDDAANKYAGPLQTRMPSVVA